MSATTGYTDIADHYRRLIEDGDLSPGDQLPTMREVCEAFGVAKATANRAFRQLKDEGLTIPRGSAGTVVAERSNVVVTGAARVERLKRTGRAYAPGETSTDHVVMTRGIRDWDVAEQLGVELGDEVLIRRRTFRMNGVPTVVALTIVHMRALADVPELLTEGPLRPFWHGTYEERTGRKIGQSPERCSARFASTDELNALEVDAPPTAAVPVLVTHTTYHDEVGPISVWEDVYAPGRWK